MEGLGVQVKWSIRHAIEVSEGEKRENVEKLMAEQFSNLIRNIHSRIPETQ